ncbi:RTA1 like protein-domain-containing protein [Lophiotrema nucula]|uniref:RTA1 like protein-domain-containing protein n=1 Tax=Lophiotrema nucula TaxID=690887 RepID=A0A6A5ZDI4_9PLEO|nr:RTA1 like protein-domain-containing protein [Lophiotrema nucula]
MSSDDSIETYKYYHYHPSVAGACVFAIIFGVSTVWHGVLIARHKTRYFIPLLVGGIFEIVGYAARGVSSQQPATKYTIAPYVIQTLLVLVAPALFAASIYMVLGRIIVSVNAESYSMIRTKWLTKVFVTSDTVTFFVQLAAGAGLMSSQKASTSKLGSHIVLAGLVLQILIFAFFVGVSVVFHRQMRACPTTGSKDPSLPWKRFLTILYVTSAFIMVRSIVRVAEFVEGFHGTIIEHEVYLYVFDAVPMAAVMFVFNFCYPANISKRARKAAMDGEGFDSNVDLPEVTR